MIKKDLKFIFAPIGVAIGMTIFITLCVLSTKALGIMNLEQTVWPVPGIVLLLAGGLCVLIFLPLFISSILFLGRRGAVGQTERLRTSGVYQYVRNPMYSGASFTIFGTGLLINNSGVALAGLLWFCMTFIQCKREEKELIRRFGREYIEYKARTPMYIPDFSLMLKHFFKK